MTTAYLCQLVFLEGELVSVGELERLQPRMVHAQLLHTLLAVAARASELGHVLAVEAVAAGRRGQAPRALAAVVLRSHLRERM